jgi:hypothetical protein
MSDYAMLAKAVAIRLYKELDEWFVDCVDTEGRFTEECWNFESLNEAITGIPAFREYYELDPSLPVIDGVS